MRTSEFSSQVKNTEISPTFSWKPALKYLMSHLQGWRKTSCELISKLKGQAQVWKINSSSCWPTSMLWFRNAKTTFLKDGPNPMNFPTPIWKFLSPSLTKLSKSTIKRKTWTWNFCMAPLRTASTVEGSITSQIRRSWGLTSENTLTCWS